MDQNYSNNNDNKTNNNNANNLSETKIINREFFQNEVLNKEL